MIKKHLMKATTALMCAMIVVSMTGCSSNSKKENSVTPTTAPATESQAASYTAGTYTGTGSGKNGTVTVDVEFSNSAITSVTVTEQNETEGIAEPAIEKIPAKIVDQQSLAVDTISGATITSQAILDAVADCVTQAGGDVDQLKTPSETAENNTEVEEAQTDVVVIGAGAAGSSAALSAVQNNQNVILLEKTSQPMGAGTLAGGMFAADSQLQKDANAVVSKEWLYEEYHKASEGYMNSLLVRRIIDESGATVDWLMENGMELNLVDAGSGSSYNHVGMPATLHGYNEGGTAAITKLIAEFEAAGGEVRWSTPAYELITEDGRVTGVLAKKEDGSTLKITAKSVIIATGGYGGNEEMLEQYLGSSYTMGEVLQNTGDGIQMAWAAGADEEGIDATHYFWETFKGEEIGKMAEILGDDWYSLTNFTMFPFLRVNALGQRYCNEANVSLFSVHGAEIAMQPKQIEYAVIDSSILNEVKEKGLYVIEDQFASWIGNEQFYMEFNEPNSTDEFYADQHTPTDYASIFDSLLETGVVFKGETIEELAANMGVDAKVLAGSVTQYNNAIATGEDDMFFADTDRLVAVTEGPYYAVKFSARNLSTLGGIRINEKMEVLNSDFEAIKGLYAAGADAGGMYGKAYVDFEGGTLGFAYTSGRLAGIAASENAAE